MPQLSQLPEPILLAGDENTLWLVRPVEIHTTGDKPLGFQLLTHETGKKQDNRDSWTLAQLPGKAPVFTGAPRLLAVMPAPPHSKIHASVYLIMEDGQFWAFSLDDKAEQPRLPEGQKPVAAVGWTDGIFVLTRGPFPARQAATTPASAPTPVIEQSPKTAILSSPTTIGALPPAVPQYWTLYRYTNRKWLPMPLGLVGAAWLPDGAAQPVLVHQPGQVTLAWFNPAAPRELFLRPLGYTENLPPSVPPQKFTLPEDLARLHTVSIGPESFLFWPAHGIPNRNADVAPAAATKTNTIELHGLALRGLLGSKSPANGSAPASQTLPLLTPVDLTPLSAGIDPLRDISVARTGNSFIAVVAGKVEPPKDDNLQSILFDTTGKALEGPSPIRPQETAESFITQNVIMVFMLVLLALALWQWRMRRIPPKLPKTLQPAYLRQRTLAAAIDLALPLLGVIIAYRLYRDNAWMGLASRWFATFQDQERWGHSPDLLWTLGLYIAHVTLSELAFGRSLGKAILGIRVVAIDGSRPRPMAIILRNLVRAIEIITGVLLIYVLLNDLHQRLGDLLARTVVVRDVVATPDAEKPPA